MARVTIPLAQVTDLPPVCVCCGEPATLTRRQEFRLGEGLSAAVLAASAVLGGLAWTERGIALTLPVCEYHRRRGRRSTRTLVSGLVLTAVLGVGAYLGPYIFPGVGGYLGVAAMFAFITTLVVGMHEVDDGLKVKTVTGDAVTLTGAHRKFAEAVGAHPEVEAEATPKLRAGR